MLHFFHVALSSCCIFSMFHFFYVAFFQCCTFFMLHFFHITLFSCCTFSMLHSRCTLFSFHVALFSCSTCLLLKNIENEWKTENTTIFQLALWICFTFILIFYHTFFVIIQLWMADKVKRNRFTIFLEKNICQGLKLLKLGCELEFISPRHKISCGYFNRDIENEWT